MISFQVKKDINWCCYFGRRSSVKCIQGGQKAGRKNQKSKDLFFCKAGKGANTHQKRQEERQAGPGLGRNAQGWSSRGKTFVFQFYQMMNLSRPSLSGPNFSSELHGTQCVYVYMYACLCVSIFIERYVFCYTQSVFLINTNHNTTHSKVTKGLSVTLMIRL